MTLKERVESGKKVYFNFYRSGVVYCKWGG